MPGDPVYPAGVTASDHIAHDMRMGRFPQQSTVEQFVAERADLDPRLLHRIRELSTPPRDDHDRAVLMLLEALLATRREADARVAAAVLGERERINARIADEIEHQRNYGDDEHARAHSAMQQYLFHRAPTPTGFDTLATLLAEAREAGRAEMREMAAKEAEIVMDDAFADDPKLHENWDTYTHSSIAANVAADIIRDRIRALPVKLPAPEAQRDE